MTNGDRKTLVDNYEKPFYKSKKFIAFVLMEVFLGGLVFYALYALRMAPDIAWPLAAFMMGLVVTMGSIALTFNGYQANLDMYVRGMALTGGVPDKLREHLKIIPPASGAAAVEPDSEEVE